MYMLTVLLLKKLLIDKTLIHRQVDLVNAR